MVKIISRQRLAPQPVYDIGVEHDHNFLLANGSVASNCFNKSHSMAYGYVTYQTAYLKANYPVEYMAALLTANSGIQDKVQKYIATCLNMNIQVESPHINRSQINFTPVDGNKILFGLSAIRNLGDGAIDCLLEAREAEGEFRSLADFCDRVDLRAVNRRALEALIQCGAFDCLNPNRNQLMHDLEFVIDWAQTRAKDRASGQGNLFDVLGGDTAGMDAGNGADNAHELAPCAPPIADFDAMEKLRLEKELLGFYVSDHPLKSIQARSRLLAPISLSDLVEQPDKTSLSAIVMLSSVKLIVTKKGDRMAIVELEDLTGQAEGVIFPRTYTAVQEHIQADARLIVWGKADRREDQTQLIIEDVEPVERAQMVIVEIEPDRANDIQQQHFLRETILSQSGNDPDGKNNNKISVVGMIRAGHQCHFVRLGPQFRVPDAQQAIAALEAAGFRAFCSTLTPNHTPVAAY
ncbi:MAG: trans-splicing intein-formed DNA polymerase III subunit alpha C-terminal partner DnaE-C [Oscillatoriales cyanobacterium]|nr:MAG: trans-splicing intein-formed DNA polymerase III subunit alpha C-terminal partner DnaE-C [Oscillatoriales cyanobacterium]